MAGWNKRFFRQMRGYAPRRRGISIINGSSCPSSPSNHPRSFATLLHVTYYNKVVPHVAQPSFIVPPIPHEAPNRSSLDFNSCLRLFRAGCHGGGGAMAGV